jgi:hypothetical protein
LLLPSSGRYSYSCYCYSSFNLFVACLNCVTSGKNRMNSEGCAINSFSPNFFSICPEGLSANHSLTYCLSTLQKSCVAAARATMRTSRDLVCPCERRPH